MMTELLKKLYRDEVDCTFSQNETLRSVKATVNRLNQWVLLALQRSCKRVSSSGTLIKGNLALLLLPMDAIANWYQEPAAFARGELTLKNIHNFKLPGITNTCSIQPFKLNRLKIPEILSFLVKLNLAEPSKIDLGSRRLTNAGS